ncbi:hypothetical protein RND71_010489 [Anisodus tanguticus]|uniref:Uncharacterized protein n=1 Tax=Anisodus tanguticus TaxID=243964 RepID=A0AAE1SJX1_9SOLA|nr:hypothetical protein RND71_010489 [Anisodus tanguticus]
MKNKKNLGDPDEWIESRAEQTYELCRTQSAGKQLTQEQMEQKWRDTIGSPTRFGAVYGKLNRAYRCYQSSLQGVGTFQDAEKLDRGMIMAMEQKIAELSSRLDVAQSTDKRMEEKLVAGKREDMARSDAQFAGMNA